MNKKIKHKGRLKQIPIYLGKLFRMFIYVNDWKVLPMSAIIAFLVANVAAKNIGKTMEGTVFGTLALACICIWNGFFNSIQVVCRERDIVKREHRDGMHISSYVSAHVIYQAFLCLMQTIITIIVCRASGLAFPKEGIIFGIFDLDMGITIFLTTFAADMMSLMISCIVRNTTSAMTVMPFVLIFELLFSGSMFELSGIASKLTNLSIAKWSINCLAAQCRFNDLPMVSIWNKAKNLDGIEYNGAYPVKEIMNYLTNNGYANEITMWMGNHSQRAEFVSTAANVSDCWLNLLMFAILFIVIAVIVLEFVDKDKR